MNYKDTKMMIYLELGWFMKEDCVLSWVTANVISEVIV